MPFRLCKTIDGLKGRLEKVVIVRVCACVNQWASLRRGGRWVERHVALPRGRFVSTHSPTDIFMSRLHSSASFRTTKKLH